MRWTINLLDKDDELIRSFHFDTSVESAKALKDLSRFVGKMVPGTDRPLHSLETEVHNV